MDWLRFGSDMLCFGKNDHLLKSVLFHIPEANIAVASPLLGGRVGPSVSGSLEITEPRGFLLELADVRGMDMEEDVLILLGGGAEVDTDSLRLRIAHDTDLLFSKQKLCGVLLSHPSRYLVGSWADASPIQPDPSLAESLRDYLSLVSAPNIQRMEDKAPDVLHELLSLHKRLSPDKGGGPQEEAVRASVEDVVDRFYEQKLTGN